MELLVRHIETALETQAHCFVRPDDLKRVWPDQPESERENVVRQFAAEHGWRVFTYSRALGAMIVPARRRS